MASCNYISKHQLQGFNRYKYSCIENGIFSVYLFQPWWNTAVKIVPLWVAPNVLTLSGFLLHVTIVLLFAYYDYDYSTTSNDWGMRKEPIPSWVWLYAAVAHFTAHTLDGIDGKQARRTKSSTPVGELFDHGLDSMVCWFIPLCVYSVVGRGQEWGSDMMDGYWAASAILAGFFLMHWEKYITGTMYIPWSYDVGEIVIMVVYLITGIFGVEFFRFNILPGWNCARCFRYGIIIGFFLTIPGSIMNIIEHFKSSKNYSDQSTVSVSVTMVSSPSSLPSSSPRTVMDYMAPSFSFILLFILTTVWVMYSPTDVKSIDPRAFLITNGLIFSNITCRLMVSQMSGQVAEYVNKLLILLALVIMASLVVPQYELMLLYSLMFIVMIVHVHYGCSVVYELCTHFNIYTFSLKKLE